MNIILEKTDLQSLTGHLRYCTQKNVLIELKQGKKRSILNQVQEGNFLKSYNCRSGGMVYTRDSKSRLARDGGSSPLSGTRKLPQGSFLLHGERTRKTE